MRSLFTTMFVASLIALFTMGCGGGGNSQDGDGTDSTSSDVTTKTEMNTSTPAGEVMEKEGLKVYALKGSPQYPNAEIKLKSPEGGTLEGPNVSFDFEVIGYELGMQTLDAEGKGIANSAKGQHIHLILNDKPYMAHYNSAFNVELEDGHYTMLAFLSRSYHESVKESFVLGQFTVGNKSEEELDLTGPLLFYSRPKGTYVSADAQRLMIDFFLVNTDLAPDGNKVRATINGVEFMFTSWEPYIVEGLPMGDVNIKLELIDAKGNVIPGPYNSVERTVSLTEPEGGEEHSHEGHDHGDHDHSHDGHSH